MISPSVNTHVEFVPLARLLYGQAIPVHSLPAIVPCPICASKRTHAVKYSYQPEEFTMRVMTVPEKGLLWYCYKCQRAWDSVELLADVNHQGDVRAAIHEIVQSAEFATPPAAFTPEMVDDYALNHAGRHVAARRWSERGRDNWARSRDTHGILAKNLGIGVKLLESPDVAKRGVGRWMHATGKKQLMELLNGGLPTNLSSSRFGTCLAVPWSDLPGRLTALLLLGWHREIKLWYPANMQTNDPGIMLLDALPPRPRRVIAVSSPWLALWLQYKYLQEHNSPAAVVAWHPRSTTAVWDQIGAEEVVFWSYMPTPSLFRQALNVPGSKVSWLDDPSVDVEYHFDMIERFDTWDEFRRLIDRPCASTKRISNLVVRTQDPYAAFRGYLLRLPPEEVASAVLLTKLKPLHINRLLDECPPLEKSQLEPLLYQTERRKERQYENGRAIQVINAHEAAWYFQKSKKHEEKISNVVALLDHFFTGDDGEIIFVGKIHYKGSSYPFLATEDELQKNPASALMKAVTQACGEAPKIRLTYSAQLWDFMWEFSPDVKTLRAITRVGWDRERQDFVTPHFAVRNGTIRVEEALGMVGAVPCAGMQPPQPPTTDDLKSWLEPTDCNGAMWAVMAAVTDNLLSYTRHEQPRGIALVGQLAQEAGTKVARNLKLIQLSSQQVNDDIKKFEKMQSRHDMPIFVTEVEQGTTMMANVSAWMTLVGPKNAMVTMTACQALSAAMCSNWMVIDTQNTRGSYEGAGSVAGIIIHYLAAFQKGTARAIEGLHHSHETLSALVEWANPDLVATAYVSNCAHEILHDGGREHESVRFIRMINQMLHDGYLNRAYSEAPGSVAVVIDPTAKAVYVSKRALIDVMFSRRLPIPDTPGITHVLREAGALLGEIGEDKDVWAIDLPFWEQEVRRWYKAITTVEGESSFEVPL